MKNGFKCALIFSDFLLFSYCERKNMKKKSLKKLLYFQRSLLCTSRETTPAVPTAKPANRPWWSPVEYSTIRHRHGHHAHDEHRHR